MREQKVLFDDGKYKILWDNGKMEALRYGEPWRDLTGDNLIYSLCDKIEALLSPKDWPKLQELSEGFEKDEYDFDNEEVLKMLNGIRADCLASHTATVAGKDREIAWLKDEIQLITAPIESTGKAMLEKDKRIIELRARVKELQSVHDSELGVCEQHCDVVKDLKDYIEDLKAEIAKLSNSAQFRRCEEQQKEIARLGEDLEKIASYQYPQHHCVEIAKKARGDGR